MKYNTLYAIGTLLGIIMLFGTFSHTQQSVPNVAAATAATCTISASATSVRTGDPVTLSWMSEAGSTKHWLYGIAPDRNGRSVSPSGSIVVNPTKTTVYTFKFEVAGAPTSCTVRVTVNTDDSCIFNGTTINHGATTTAYQAASVPAGSTCVSQIRTCNNGTLSGSYTQSTCSVEEPPITTCTISVSPTITFGETQNTISWAAPTGTTAHKLYGIPGDSNGRSVQANGSVSVVATTTRYFTLRYSLNGSYTSCSALLTVPVFHSPTTSEQPKEELVLALFGQSFAQALFADPARAAFVAELNKAGYPVTILFHGSGGSSALKEHAPVGYADRYWWNLDTQRPGPQLLTALDVLRMSPKRPTKILWLQGEGDSMASQVTGSSDRYYRATAQIIWALKKAANPTDPNSVQSYMHIIGRRISSAPNLPGIQFIRNQQLAIIDKSSLEFLVDTWDLPLLGDEPSHPGDSHMNSDGNTLLGWRAAQSVLASLGEPAHQAPSVHTVRNIDGQTIQIQFKTATDPEHSTLTNPSRPSHIAVQVGTTVYSPEQLSFRWVSNTTLDITLPEKTQADITVLYPYGALSIIDRANIIKDGNGTPVRSFSVTRKAP